MEKMSDKGFRFALLALVLLVALGSVLDVMEVDAAQYASMSQDMLSSDNWLQLYHRGEDYLDLPAVSGVQELPVPHDLVDRVGDILLCLEADDLLDLRRVAHAGQRDRPRENHVRGDGVVHAAALEPEFGDELLDLELCLRRARRVRGWIPEDFDLLEPGQNQAAIGISLEFGQTDRLRAEIQCEDSLGCGHSFPFGVG